METYSKLHELISGQVAKINAQKESILKTKLFEYLGYEIDIIKESQRKFPRLLREMHPDHVEIFFWNDGSESGYRIVTFKPIQNMETNDLSGKITMDINYF